MKEEELLSADKMDGEEQVHDLSSKSPSGKPRKKWFCCGPESHFAKSLSCPALNDVCRKCNKKWHFERVSIYSSLIITVCMYDTRG